VSSVILQIVSSAFLEVSFRWWWWIQIDLNLFCKIFVDNVPTMHDARTHGHISAESSSETLRHTQVSGTETRPVNPAQIDLNLFCKIFCWQCACCRKFDAGNVWRRRLYKWRSQSGDNGAFFAYQRGRFLNRYRFGTWFGLFEITREFGIVNSFLIWFTKSTDLKTK
jgi:hypothetical protein